MQDTSHKKNGILVSLGNFFFLHRNWMLTVVMISLIVIFKPTYPGNSAYLDMWLDIAGIIIIVAGQAIRALTIGLQYIMRGGKNGHVYANDLVTGGLFSHCRNPLYVGNIMIYIGLFVIFNNPMVYLIGIPFIFLVYISIVAAEEKFLGDKFGPEYEDYCKRVNRWFPRLSGLRKTLKGMTFSWVRVIIREYSSTYTWIIGVLSFLAYERYVNSPEQNHLVSFIVLALIWIIATILWGTARHLKLSGKLKAD